MKLLCFQTKRFRWKSHSKTLPDVPDLDIEESVAEAVVIFVHAEAKDESDERQGSVLRQSLKHIKWLANKRGLKHCAALLHPPGRRDGERSLCPSIYRRISPTAARNRLPGLDHTVRLFLRVGFERLRRQSGEGLERNLAAQRRPARYYFESCLRINSPI